MRVAPQRRPHAGQRFYEGAASALCSAHGWWYSREALQHLPMAWSQQDQLPQVGLPLRGDLLQRDNTEAGQERGNYRLSRMDAVAAFG